jgi:hypothetical protein
MPAARSGAGTGASRGGGSRGRRAPSAGLFNPVIDAMDAAARSVSGGAALDAVDAFAAAPDAIEGIGRGFRTVGRTIADEIDWDPRVVEFFDTLGDAIIAAAEPARRGAAAVKRAEAERIRNAEEGGERRARWDVGRNQR